MRIGCLLAILGFAGLALNGLGATFIVLNNNDSGSGSLRQAIFDANDNPGKDIVQFDIVPGGPQTIDLFAEGLAITDPITIDGSSQPGFVTGMVIVADGTPEAARRLSRVLWNDPASGVMRHADAGYQLAIDCARGSGLNLPSLG